MIHYELLSDQAVLIVTPDGALEQADFETLALVVDPYIEDHGGLKGLMIYVDSFPGWEDFAGFVSHIQFVKSHQKYLAKIAAVTDSRILAIIPSIADHFIKAEIKHFDFDDKQAALDWLIG